MISWEDSSEEDEEPEQPKAPRRPAAKAPIVVGGPERVSQSKPKKNKSPVQTLLKIIRSSPTCLIALEIEETGSDLRILRAVQAIPEDEIEMFFRDCGFREDIVSQIAELLEVGRPQIEELSSSILRRTWCLVLQMLTCCAVGVILAAAGFFAVSLGYSEGSCQFSDFTNGTCQQGNVCQLQIAAWHSEGIAYYNAFSPPVASSESAGLKAFDTNGAFRCCNFAQQAALWNSIPKDGSEGMGALGVGYGSGTPCCDFYNARTKVFCDNFGTIQQFSHCPAAPWACRLKLGVDDNGNSVVDELRVWEEPLYLLLLAVAGGFLGLALMIAGCGIACKHSERLQAFGLFFWRCGKYVLHKVGCGRRCKWCCGAICGRCRRYFRVGPTREERVKERQEAREEQARMKQAAFVNNLRRTQTLGELDLTRNSWKNSLGRWSMMSETVPKVELRPQPSPARARPRPKRKVKKTRVERLKPQEVEEDEAGGLRTSSSNAGEDTSESENSKASEDDADQIRPWSIEDVGDLEEATPAAPSSRPATMNLQSMLRPIMTPMQQKRRPKIMSQKFGLQDPFGSTTSSFASGYVAGYDTRSSFGTASKSSTVGASIGTDGMAQTFSEGFGMHRAGRHHRPTGERRQRKRRAKDRPGRVPGGTKTRTAWAIDEQQPTGPFRRRYSEQ